MISDSRRNLRKPFPRTRKPPRLPCGFRCATASRLLAPVAQPDQRCAVHRVVFGGEDRVAFDGGARLEGIGGEFLVHGIQPEGLAGGGLRHQAAVLQADLALRRIHQADLEGLGAEVLVADGYAALVALAGEDHHCIRRGGEAEEGAASRPARVRAIAFFILISFGKD